MIYCVYYHKILVNIYTYSENKALLPTGLNHGAVLTLGKEEGKRQHQKDGVLVRSTAFCLDLQYFASLKKIEYHQKKETLHDSA